MPAEILVAGMGRLLTRLRATPARKMIAAGGCWPHRLCQTQSPSIWQPERHTRHEVASINSGSCVMTLEKQAYQETAGDICVVAPGVVH
jgi:mannose-6-phosphate isomerase-like protein (cupin superfamily)